MNVNKKFDRFKQWGRERMGGEVATSTPDEFKALEGEMELRHQGMEKLQLSTGAYIKSLSRRDQGEGKEKQLAVAAFGSTLVSHGDDFEPDSEFGQCLLGLGRANERIARMQETYCANATSSWLESVERSMVQMKEWQAARKRLEQRRLAYDTASAKMQKSKKEDFKMEEELRSQKAKYEESFEDVFRRMMDVKEAEADSVGDLTSFLDAELAYYDRCRDVLLQLKRDWPATLPANTRSSSPANSYLNRTRSRAGSNTDRFNRATADDYSESANSRPTIRSRTASGQDSPRRELPAFEIPSRPTISRNNSSLDGSITAMRPGISRTMTEPVHDFGGATATTNGMRGGYRRDNPQYSNGDVFSDDLSDRSADGGGGSQYSNGGWSHTAQQQQQNGSGGRKAPPPPPPPPSRSKKPPPPPPMKRSTLSSSEVSRY